MPYTIRENEGWWETRWHIYRSPESTAGDRFWAMSEMACSAVTLGTLAVGCGVVAVWPFTEIPPFLHGWVMQLLLAGACGYGTTFIAVQMLFRPRKRVTWIPMRWIWPQGLIPANQTELANIVGTEVAARLLTPEAVVDEFAQLVEIALEDRKTFLELEASVNATIKRELPTFLERFLPEALDLLQDTVQESLPPEAVKRVLLEIVSDWFRDPRNHAALAAFLISLVQAWSSDIVKLMRATTKRFGKTHPLRSFALGAASATNIIDWDGLEKALRREAETTKGRKWAMELVARFGNEVQAFADEVIRTEVLEEMKTRTGKIALDAVADAAEKAVAPRIISMIESPRFKSFILDEVIPRAKPRVVGWIKEGHLAPFLERFDVKGRVAQAAGSLKTSELEDLANRVGAYHLAVIQVLCYLLGLVFGVLSVLVGMV